MGSFNPFYYLSYFIKCLIRNFSKRYFKIILFFIVCILIFMFYNKCFAIDTNNITYIDNIKNDTNIMNWVSGFSEYNNNDYFYFICMDYPGTGPVASTGVPLVAFINKSSYYNNNIKMYWEAHPSYYYLVNLMFNKQFTYKLALNYGSLSDVTDSGIFFLRTHDYTTMNIYTNLPVIYTNSSFTNISYQTNTYPFFVNTTSQLETFDFDYFTINGGSMPYKSTIEGIEHIAKLSLDYNYKGVRTNIDLTNYIQVIDNMWTINIPYNVINNNVVVKNGESFYYRFSYELYGSDYNGNISIDGTYNLTTEEENTINQEGNKQLLNQLQENQNATNQKLDEQTNAINKQTNSINDLNDSINDSNVDNIDSDTLPSDSTNDITEEGVNGIFTSIYNAFCVGDPVNINFPIPNTNKSISLSPSYVYDNLSNFGGGYLVLLIQAFWWYIISRFIIKDIMNKINKIKSGNIEEIETSNIRGDML